MTDTQKDILFDQFIKDQLDEAERERFLALLRENPDWLDELQTRRVALLLGDRLAEKELSRKFREWDLDLEKNRKNKALWVKIAGWLLALSLLVFVVTQFRNKTGQESAAPPTISTPDSIQEQQKPIQVQDTVAAKNSSHKAPKPQPASTLIALRERKGLATTEMDLKRNSAQYRGGGRKDNPISKIDSMFAEKVYAAAMPLIAALPEDAAKTRYRAYALFYQNRYTEAAAAFRAWEKQSGDAHTANWYILLCCICSKEIPDANCVELLKNTASDSSNPYSIEASYFLKK